MKHMAKRLTWRNLQCGVALLGITCLSMVASSTAHAQLGGGGLITPTPTFRYVPYASGSAGHAIPVNGNFILACNTTIHVPTGHLEGRIGMMASNGVIYGANRFNSKLHIYLYRQTGNGLILSNYKQYKYTGYATTIYQYPIYNLTPGFYTIKIYVSSDQPDTEPILDQLYISSGSYFQGS